MFFNRVVFSTFLFLALICFGISSAYADIRLNYYQSQDYQHCDTSIQSICDYTVTGFGSNPNYTYSTCRKNGTSLEVARKQRQVSYFNNPDGSTTETVTYVDNGYVYVGNEQFRNCPEGSTLKLTGCTATCQIDPCLALKDQQFSGAAECGTFSCPNGGVIQGTTSLSCTSGKPSVLLSAASSVIDPLTNCQGTLVSQGSGVSAKFADVGKTGGTLYCSATYKNLGVSAPAPDPLPNIGALSFYDAVLPNNGICPSSKPQPVTINGVDACIDNKLPDSPCPISNEKPNSNGVCVAPDDPTYPKDNDPTKADPKTSCPTGQIRNNSGTCVPYADAGKCPTGQIKDSAGASCINDPKANSCPTGQVKNKTTGSCSNDPRGTGCANNQLPDKLGMCPDGSASCAVGKIRNASGVCVGSDPTKPPEGTGCKDGSTPNSSGVCSDGSASCPAGKVRGSDGKCALDTTESNTTGTASSDCDVAPDCGGDPLQCATLEQIWRSSCEQTKAFSETSKEDAEKMASAATASQAEYDAHQAAIDSQATGFFSEFESKASSVSASGQCINDLSVPVMGHSMVIPFSQACDFFRFLRILVLFSAYMLAARIIFGGLT